MKKLLLLALLALATGSLTGCGKSADSLTPTSDAGASAADQAEVAAAVAASPEYTDEDVHASSMEMALQDAPEGALTAIRPLRWWRSIDDVSRRIETEWAQPDSNGRPTMAFVTIHKRLVGELHIVYGAVSDTDTTVARVDKPLDDRWVRRLALQRKRVNEDSTRSVWRVVGTSGVEVKSEPVTSDIQSIRLQAGAVDTTITDPLQLHRLRHLIFVDPSTPLRLTVTTSRADDTVLLYRHDLRRRFQNNGDGTYTLEWTTGDFGGLRHFGVNVLSHGTLFDDQAPYDSNAWILPFAVRRPDCEIGERR